MKSRTTWLYRVIVVFALCLPTGVVHGQQESIVSVQSSAAIESERRAGNNFHSSFASSEFAFDGRVVVQRAPFSAVGIKETTQILSDGRRLVRRMATTLYRNSEGSTRNEWGSATKAKGGVPIIYDAATGAVYFLNSHDRRALQLPSSLKGSGARQARVVTPQSQPEDLTRVVGETIERLGKQTIEGVEAEGVRVTTTIPADLADGKQAAKVVFERWYSHELRRNVLIKCTDPRFGEAVFRLTSINRNEPERELFTIPAGFTISPMMADKPTSRVKTSYAK